MANNYLFTVGAIGAAGFFFEAAMFSLIDFPGFVFCNEGSKDLYSPSISLAYLGLTNSGITPPVLSRLSQYSGILKTRVLVFPGK